MDARVECETNQKRVTILPSCDQNRDGLRFPYKESKLKDLYSAEKGMEGLLAEGKELTEEEGDAEVPIDNTLTGTSITSARRL